MAKLVREILKPEANRFRKSHEMTQVVLIKRFLPLSHEKLLLSKQSLRPKVAPFAAFSDLR